jgi:hypothetical protein
MNAVVHQLVHGYEKGHSLLASSCSLPKPALEMVREQSDLSGPLPAGVSVPPYLTAYPVAGTDFYALGRTWPDIDAPRSGCVITHTLLIPLADWGSTTYPAAYLQLHERPNKQSLDRFRRELPLPTHIDESSYLDWLNPEEADEFARKVFVEELRSVVWFDCEKPDQLVISFATLLWPSVRSSLYAHTFSLYPHAKVRSDVQLHFAPRTAQSYFSRVPKQCQMNRRHGESRSDAEQDWVHELSEDLRVGRPRDSYLSGLRQYGSLLGNEPSAVRNLFALRDLADRQSQTPTAAVGILDIIDSLEPAADRAIEEKQRALSVAVELALNADTQATLHCLSLVDARLRRPSFSVAGNDVQLVIKETVERIVAKEPLILLAACGQGSPAEDSLFWQGVTNGMRTSAESRPEALETLDRYPNIASFVVREAPSVARAYLSANHNRRSESIYEATKWAHKIERDEQRHRLRRELLPESNDEASVPLLKELLRDVSAADVNSVLDSLVESSNAFGIASLRQTVTDFVCQRYPDETILWSQRSKLLQIGYVAEVVADAFPTTPDGLERILVVDWTTPDDRCEVLSAFIERAAKNRLPQWFVRRATEDMALLDLYAICTSLSARATRALQVVVDQCDYLPIARSSSFRAFLERIDEGGLVGIFAPKVVDSAIVEHFAGRIQNDQMVEALNLDFCARHCEQVDGDHIRNLLTSGPDTDAWQRAWTTFSLLPSILFRKVASNKIIADFTKSFRANWTEDVAHAWSLIMKRAQEELPYEAALRLHVESNSFGLNNPRLPVGIVVGTAFPYVYDAVSRGTASHVTDELFGYFDWDKAKTLRKEVLNSFVGSCWAPEDLAFLASKCQILRKVIHRLQRKWGGDDYIRRMMNGLRNHRSPEASTIVGEMSTIVNDPDFFEPWD